MSGSKPPPFIPLTLDLGGAVAAERPAERATGLAVSATSTSTGPHNPHLDRLVEELELSVRSANCLQEANIRYIGELVQKSELELLKMRNFGRKNLVEIRLVLEEIGLAIEMPIAGWVPPA